MTQTRESRPSMAAEAARSVVATQDQSTDVRPRPHLTADERAASTPAYALMVKTPSERVSRRLFLSLHAAVKAAERAQNRGSAVHLEMVRVVPHTTGRELHGLEAVTDDRH